MGDATEATVVEFALTMLASIEVTTVEAALAAVQGMAEQLDHPLEVKSLQEYHGR